MVSLTTMSGYKWPLDAVFTLHTGSACYSIYFTRQTKQQDVSIRLMSNKLPN